MNRKVFLFLISFCLVVSVVPASSYKEVTVSNGAILTGTIRLPNYQPSGVEIEVKKDAAHCGNNKSAGCLMVGKNGELANAIVSLEGVTQGKKFAPSTRAVVLDQQKCEYVPHVLVLAAGSNLEIANSDPMLHNVHSYNISKVTEGTGRPSTEFNIALPLKGQKITKQMKEPGFYTLTCDAGHPWMSAHIVVAAHPYYTVSNENGKYRLDGVPPGKYKIRVWHEGQPKAEGSSVNYFMSPLVAEKEVTVPPGKEVKIDFHLKAP